MWRHQNGKYYPPGSEKGYPTLQEAYLAADVEGLIQGDPQLLEEAANYLARQKEDENDRA